jgi:multiple antibiotic resistance protein
MPEPLTTFIEASLVGIGALFPIVNPLGIAPIFYKLTEDYEPAIRFWLARRIALNGFMLLIGSMVVGTHVLGFFGISLPVVQVGGGLLLLSTGWALLNPPAEEESAKRKQIVDPATAVGKAFYPLTLPVTVGPGSISVAVTLGVNAANSPHRGMTWLGTALMAPLVISLCIFLCYRFADRLEQAFGKTGMSVILRLSSFILLCIGVQIFWNGVSALLKTLPR